MFPEIAASLVSVVVFVAALRVAYIEGKTEGYAQAAADCDNANHVTPPF